MSEVPDPYAVTILRPVDRRRLMTKEYILAPDGRVQRNEYPEAKTFSVEQARIADVEDLHRLLVKIEADPTACIIRGNPLPGTDWRQTRRLLRDRNEARAAFGDPALRWVMLDADKIAVPASVSVINDPQDVARHLVDLFAGYAPELEGVTAVVQFSSSAGIAEQAEAEAAAGMPNRWGDAAGKGGTISAHIWFMLEEPQDGAALKRWALAINAREGDKVIDPATMVANQVHYTAAPVFASGLRDPLQGRRVVLVEGYAAAAKLEIPAEAPRPVYTGGSEGGSSEWGLGFPARLERIGAPEHGFHAPINAAIASYVATNWPAPDTAELIRILQARIEAADPGGRSATEIKRYASAATLQERINWTIAAEAAKRRKQAEERAALEARASVAPTFPDRGVTLEEGFKQASAAMADFADRLRAGERPDMLLRVTVGGGKSEAAVRGAGMLLDAAHEGGREGALFYMVPRHDLGSEIAQRIAAAHPGKSVAVWRGRDADDPDAKGAAMCLDPDLPEAATAAGVDTSTVCNACPLRHQCGYQRQRGQRADIWIAAHNLAFQGKPTGLPQAAAVVVDEGFWGAAISGADRLHPYQIFLASIEDEGTGFLKGVERQRLHDLRARVARILARHERGRLMRDAFLAEGFTAESAKEWKALEWSIKPPLKFQGEVPRDTIMEELRKAHDTGFLMRRAKLATFLHELLESGAARSVNAIMEPEADLGRGQGKAPAVQMAWRDDFAQWSAEAPRLFLDATTHPELAKVWAPDLAVVDVEIAAPSLHVRQVIGKQFGRATFTFSPGNVGHLADLVMVELAKAGGDQVLVIAQKAVKDLLQKKIEDRFQGALPAGLEMAHHGAVTGMDRWRGVARLVVVGRPATNRLDGERLAEIVAGKPVAVEAAGSLAYWPTIPGGIRRPDGRGTPVDQPRHPDPLVEALRWSITEGAVLQAIGRARGVQRTSPVHVTLLAEFALPLTVETVEGWEDAAPDRLTTAAAAAALTGSALPLAPADMVIARPDLWGSETAAKRSLGGEESSKGSVSLIEDTYKGIGPFSLLPARYRKGLRGRWSMALVPAEGGEQALAAIVGPLAAYETVAEAAGKAQTGVGAAAAASPAADPAEALVPAEAAGARLFHLGDDPPLPGEAIGSRPIPASVPPASAVALLTELTIRLEGVRPPRLHGDGMDLARIDWWDQRRAAARARWPVQPVAAEAGGAARGAG